MTTDILLAPARPLVPLKSLPELVEQAGGAARFAWDEFFYAEHYNPHTQKAYERAVRLFLGWADWQGVELKAITPGMVGQYRRLGRITGEAKPAPLGVTRFLRSHGQPACLHSESGGVGQGREGSGDRG